MHLEGVQFACAYICCHQAQASSANVDLHQYKLRLMAEVNSIDITCSIASMQMRLQSLVCAWNIACCWQVLHASLTPARYCCIAFCIYVMLQTVQITVRLRDGLHLATHAHAMATHYSAALHSVQSGSRTAVLPLAC